MSSLGGTRWIGGGGWSYRQPPGRRDMLVHLPVLKMHERSGLTSPKIPEVLACIIHVVEGAKSLLCYKHVVKTVFEATKKRLPRDRR